MIVLINPFILGSSSGPVPNAPSYFNSGGEGPRTNIVTATSSGLTFGTGTAPILINGVNDDALWFSTTVPGTGVAWFHFDFGVEKIIDEITWAQSTSSAQGTWRFEGSTDDSSWTQIDSDFTLNTGTFLSGTNTTPYRYYRLRHMSGNRNSTPFLREIRFRIDEPDTAAKYTNSGGRGDRTGIITASQVGIAADGGTPTQLIDGATGTSASTSYAWETATGDGTDWVLFDFGSPKIIDEFTWLQSVAQAQGVWRFEGSPDNSAWTQLGSDFTLIQGIFQCPNSTAYRYYRLRHMSGSRNIAYWQMEILFQIA